MLLRGTNIRTSFTSAPARLIARYAMAVVLVSASFLLRFVLVQHFGEQLPPFIKQLPPFIICYPIVMLVALLAGLGPGLLATALGVLGTAFFIMSPNGSFAVANSFQAVALVLFAGTGVFMSLVAARYRQSQQLVTAYRERRARQEGKVLYRTLFNTMDEGFCIIEMIFDAAGKAVDYRFLEVNSVFEQQTSLRDTVGRRVRDLAPSIEDFWIETYGEVALTGEPVHFFHESKILDRYFEARAYRFGEPALRQVAVVFSDITERRRISGALRESEARLKEAQNTAHIGSWVYRPSDIHIWSDEMYELFKLDRDAPVTHDSALSVIHPEDREDVYERNFSKVFESGAVSIDVEFRVIWPGSQIRWMSAIGKIRRDEAGRVIEAVGTVQDITEHKQAEQAIRDSEEKFRTLADLVPQMVWICTPDGMNVFFNQRWVTYTGMTLAESYGRGWYKPFHDDDRQRAWDAWNHAAATGDSYQVESRLRKADGSYHWFLMQGAPFRDASGSIVRWFGTCTYIEDMKLAEEALRKSELEFRLLFEQIPDGIFVSDAQGRFLDVNPAGVNVMGYAPDELRALTIPDILPAEETERLPYELGRLAGGATLQSEWRYKRKDGSVFDGSNAARQLSDGRFLTVVRDITEEKHLEEDKKKLLDAVQKERDSLSALISAMKDEVWFIDAERRVGLVNPVALTVFGSNYTANVHIEELGKGIEFRRADGSLRPIEDSPPLRALGGEMVRDEEEILRLPATGESRHREVSAAPIKDASGAIIGSLVVVHDITKRKRAEEQLRRSEMLYHGLFSSMNEGFCRIEVIFDPENKPVDFRFIEVNEAFLSQFGLHDVVGKRIREISPTLEEHWFELYGKVALTGEPVFVSDAEGLNRNFEVHAYRAGEPNQQQVAIVFNDISVRKRSEEQIRQLNRVYSVLSDINQTIVRETTSQAMLEAACRIAVEKGEFRMAWIGMIDPTTSHLNRVASSGFVDGYLDRVRIDLLDSNSIGGPIEHCVRSGEHTICNDIEHELMRPWKNDALQNGYRSLAAFPLQCEGNVVGVFTLYASELAFFNESETKLLDELATDISFALEVNRNEEDRRRKEEQLGHLNRVYNILSDLNRTIIREKSSAVMLEAACRVAVDLGRFRMAWIGMIDPVTQVLKPVVSYGAVDGYLDQVRIDVHDHARDFGPAAVCTHSGEHAFCNDIEHDPTYLPWREAALQRGYRSLAALPLVVDGRVIGVLSLYASEAGFFKGDELALLDQMAMDIGFALEVNRNEEDRKKKEEELLWRTAFFEAQVDSALDGVLVVDAQGKKMLQNKRLNEMFRLPANVYENSDDAKQREFVGTLVRNSDQFEEKIRYLYSHPDEVSLDEIEMIDGRTLERYSSPVRDKSGKRYGRIWTFRDITARLRLEEQFRQAQKMEAIGQLTGGIAHDFNNLLAVIVGNLDLLERQITDNEAAVKRLNTARNASLRGAEVTRRLLAFARQQDLKPAAIDLNTVIETVLALAAPALGPTIQVITQLAPSMPRVFADASGLESALLNLVVNARDAMAKGGKLTLTSELRTVDSDQFLGKANELTPGCYAFVAVSDTGHGMTKETVQRVFEPFFTTKSHGTGLGLAMVYGFFKQSGGTVRIYSEPGSGTTFSFFLPILAGAADLAPTPVPEAYSPSLSRGTILIVDDEGDLIEVAATCLSDLGYSVLAAKDGVSAIQVLAERDDIGLLLTDVMMPGGMNGVELAQRATEMNSQIRVIYCSGFPADALKERALSLTEGPLLRKPYQRSELLAIVSKVLAEANPKQIDGKSTSNEAP